MPKHSAWTEDFNRALGQMQSGGLLYHFYHEPIPLEITMDYSVFTFVDDSEEKLSMETFLILFIFLLCGLMIAPLVLLWEIWVYRKKEMGKMERRKQRIAS